MGSEALKAANTMQVRQHNKTVIRQAMLCLRQATRPQLAQKTGLSQVTVSAVLAELMEKGEVESCGSVPSEGGRPSACYRYRGERHNAGVLYTYQMEGRTLVQLEVFDLFGDRVDRASQFLGDLRPESFDALLDAAVSGDAGHPHPGTRRAGPGGGRQDSLLRPPRPGGGFSVPAMERALPCAGVAGKRYQRCCAGICPGASR